MWDGSTVSFTPDDATAGQIVAAHVGDDHLQVDLLFYNTDVSPRLEGISELHIPIIEVEDNKSRLAVVEHKTSDIDIIQDSVVLGSAALADSGITIIPKTAAALHAAILDKTFDPANIPGSQVWSTSLTTSAEDDIVLLRIGRHEEVAAYRYTRDGTVEPIYTRSILPRYDSSWVYYSLGQFASGLAIVLRKRQHPTHTQYKGALPQDKPPAEDTVGRIIIEENKRAFLTEGKSRIHAPVRRMGLRHIHTRIFVACKETFPQLFYP